MDVGDIVEDFTLNDERGEQRTLSGLLEHGPVVLFFYPAAFTPGCTAEVCHFRDIADAFTAVGAQPIGISGDPVQRQAEFADRYGLGYPLLSDPDGLVRAQFGVRGSFVPTRRVTFVIDTNRRVLDVIRSEIRMSVHADKALAAIRRRGVTGTR